MNYIPQCVGFAIEYLDTLTEKYQAEDVSERLKSAINYYWDKKPFLMSAPDHLLLEKSGGIWDVTYKEKNGFCFRSYEEAVEYFLSQAEHSALKMKSQYYPELPDLTEL